MIAFCAFVMAGALVSVAMMDWSPIAATILGALWQWTARAHKGVPSWLGYVLLCMSAITLWLIASPEVDAMLHAPRDLNTVRALAASAWMFYLAVRGAAAQAKDVRLAPETNSIG